LQYLKIRGRAKKLGVCEIAESVSLKLLFLLHIPLLQYITEMDGIKLFRKRK